MDNINNYEIIKNYLENALTGAKMEDDLEMQLRLSRAIVAFEADTEEDIFTDEFVEKIVTP
jgi:hypothetical protein